MYHGTLSNVTPWYVPHPGTLLPTLIGTRKYREISRYLSISVPTFSYGSYKFLTYGTCLGLENIQDKEGGIVSLIAGPLESSSARKYREISKDFVN